MTLNNSDEEMDDTAIVEAVRAGRLNGTSMLFDRYCGFVQRTLVRVLGMDHEIEDLLHEVFVEAFDSIDQLRDPTRLKPWLGQIAVFRARGMIRYRVRRRWLVFRPSSEMPVIAAPPDPHSARDLLQRVFSILEQLGTDERIAFSLRYVEEMKLTEAAHACDVSLATFKRRLKKTEKAFMTRAKRDPDLHAHLQGNCRWGAST